MPLDADHVFPESSIKLYAWEHAFLRRVLFVRNEEELKMLRKIGICTVSISRPTRLLLNSELLSYRHSTQRSGLAFRVGVSRPPANRLTKINVPQVLVAFSSFATAAKISSKPLTSDIIFPAISLFMLLQFPLAMVGCDVFHDYFTIFT
jgi:ATP-binding cassette, subfamily C (CFTR/MRP), member 1